MEILEMTRLIPCLFATVLLLLSPAASAQQAPPFFGGGGTGFDPEVGVVRSGALLDATATVSSDRKYVTVTTGATNTRLRDLVLFPVTSIGFVGGLNPGGGGTGGGAGAGAGQAPTGGSGRASTSGLHTSPTAISNISSILNREGMFLLEPL
jgi:hypothetical protein